MYSEDWQPPPNINGYFDQTVKIGDASVSLGEIDALMSKGRPTYDKDLVCADKKELGTCCPNYCCNLESTAHSLDINDAKPDLGQQTAVLKGNYEILE